MGKVAAVCIDFKFAVGEMDLEVPVVSEVLQQDILIEMRCG